MLIRRVSRLLPWLATAVLVVGCDAPPQVSTAAPAEITAPPPAANPQPDVNAMPVERAAPPVLKPVALGEYDPGNPVATAISGKLTIEDAVLRGENGASFTTERVAIVKGGDPYSAGSTYAQAMQIDPEDTVELRRVLEQTPPTQAPALAGCSACSLATLPCRQRRNVLRRPIGADRSRRPSERFRRARSRCRLRARARSRCRARFR